MDKRVAKVLQSSTVQLYFHCCVIDGVVSAADAGVRLHPALLTDAARGRGQQQTRRRVLSLFQHREWLSPEAVETLQCRCAPPRLSRFRASPLNMKCSRFSALDGVSPQAHHPVKIAD